MDVVQPNNKLLRLTMIIRSVDQLRGLHWALTHDNCKVHMVKIKECASNREHLDELFEALKDLITDERIRFRNLGYFNQFEYTPEERRSLSRVWRHPRNKVNEITVYRQDSALVVIDALRSPRSQFVGLHLEQPYDIPEYDHSVVKVLAEVLEAKHCKLTKLTVKCMEGHRLIEALQNPNCPVNELRVVNLELDVQERHDSFKHLAHKLKTFEVHGLDRNGGRERVAETVLTRRSKPIIIIRPLCAAATTPSTTAPVSADNVSANGIQRRYVVLCDGSEILRPSKSGDVLCTVEPESAQYAVTGYGAR
jgi:hypothetical protein